MNRDHPSIQRRVIAEESIQVDWSLEKLNLEVVRRTFSDLFDRAAVAVHRAGHDLDDVVVERRMICRTTDGFDRDVSVFFMSNVNQMVENTVTQLVNAGLSATEARCARILAMKCEAVLETIDSPPRG